MRHSIRKYSSTPALSTVSTESTVSTVSIVSTVSTVSTLSTVSTVSTVSVNGVNSVNSHSVVLPPSPMVFFCICICQHLLTPLSRDRWVARNNGDWQILSISSVLHSPQLHCTHPTSQYFPAAPQKCTKAMKQMPKHDLFSDALSGILSS